MKHNPFAHLRDTLGMPDAPAEAPPAPEPVSAVTSRGTGGPPRAVVRYERAGRGGKEVTIVEQLNLSQAELSAWLKSLKASLGCGGSLDGDTLVLQGDHRKRLPGLLGHRGVRKVIVG